MAIPLGPHCSDAFQAGTNKESWFMSQKIKHGALVVPFCPSNDRQRKIKIVDIGISIFDKLDKTLSILLLYNKKAPWSHDRL